MPANSTGTIAIVVLVDGKASYAYSPADTLVGVRAIPGGGTTLTLPAAPENGDVYEFSDVDGSCAVANPITLDGNGHTIRGAAMLAFAQPYSSATVAYVAAVRAWAVIATSLGNGGGGGTNATSIQGTPVEAPPPSPTQSEVLVFDSGPGQYDVRQLTSDDILPGFSIASFTGGSTVEVGATVTNPPFAATYSSTPDSAQITNTDGTDSPLVLVTPFTAGTVVGAFHKTAQATVTFTLSATKGVTRTASQAITFLPRSFGGVGTAGAVSATAVGTTAVLNGGLGTLASVGLFASVIGQTFGPFAPAAQKIYLLVPHTATPHAFKDQNGFTFAMNAPTTFAFTNANGAVLSMDLYESTNVLGSSFSILVVT